MARVREPVARVALVVSFVGLTTGTLSSLDPPRRPGDTAAGAGGATPAPPASAPPCTPAPLEERAGQVLVVGLPGVTGPFDRLVNEVLTAHAGGVQVTADNVESKAQLRRLVEGIRSRAGRPLVVAADEESGRVSALRELIGNRPSARELAEANSPTGVLRVARRMGAELAAAGFNVDLAPVADLDSGPAGGVVGDRSFSSDPDTAARYALAYARGLAAEGVHPTAKHFPGHGRTSTDTHRALPKVDASLEELSRTDVRPFAALVREGVPAVLVNHVAYTALDGLPASLSPGAYRLLRNIGFKGAAITDSVDMGAVHPRWSFGEATVRAVRAGADGVLSTDGRPVRTMRDALVRAVRAGRLDERRLNEAAGRMLALAGGDPAGFTCEPVALPTLKTSA